MHDFLFADDCALNANSEDEMHSNMDIFSSACDAFGLAIGTKKMEVMFRPKNTHIQPSQSRSGRKLQTVDKFTYLSRTLSRNVLVNDKVDARIAKSKHSFQKAS